MRGGLERWKRGVESRGVRHAIAYALEGTCDAHLPHLSGADALEAYGLASDSTVARFIVDQGRISADELTASGLRVWLTGHDPVSIDYADGTQLEAAGFTYDAAALVWTFTRATVTLPDTPGANQPAMSTP